MRKDDLDQRLAAVKRAQRYWADEGKRVGDPLFEDRVFDLLSAIKLDALTDQIDKDSMPLPVSGNVFEDIDAYQEAEISREDELVRVAKEELKSPMSRQEVLVAATQIHGKELETKIQTIASYIAEHEGSSGAQARAIENLADYMGGPVGGEINLDYNGLVVAYDHSFWQSLSLRLRGLERSLEDAPLL